MTDATAVEGEVDHRLAGSRPVEGPGRAADEDRTEDRDFDGVVGHEGNGRRRMVTWCTHRARAFFVGAEGFEPSLGTV